MSTEIIEQVHAEVVEQDRLHPHALYRVTGRGGEVRFAMSGADKDGNFNPRYNPKHETIEQLGIYQSIAEVRAERMRMVRKHNPYYGRSAIEAINLPNFEIGLPQGVHDRRDVFLGLDQEEQEEILYAATLCTGLPLKRIYAWLMVRPDQMEHINLDILSAARAELDLRIARKMIGFALSNNSPTAMTATLYLTKVFLGFSEQGMSPTDSNPGTQLDGAKNLLGSLNALDVNLNIIQNNSDEVNALRAELDTMVTAADKADAARLS